MKSRIIRLCLLPLMALLMTSRLRADMNINWTADSPSAFDVTISGSGFSFPADGEVAAGFIGTITSPSGLWQLDMSDYCFYDVNRSPFPDLPIRTSLWGDMFFIGNADPDYFNCFTPDRLRDWKPAIAPVGDGDIMFAIGPAGWAGVSSITLTSLPDLNDPSTWTWMAEYNASGPALDVVPEPETVCLILFSAGIFVLRKFTGENYRNRMPGTGRIFRM
jgi:hypothetical protein